MRRPRIILADDHVLVVAGLRKLLEPEFEVIATVADGYSLVRAAQELRPDVILLDISMPLLNGIDAARELKRTVPGAKLIFVTMHADADYVSAAAEAGASGYLLKRSAASELVAAIRQVLLGRTHFTPLAAANRPGSLLDPGKLSSALTGRQRQVLQLIAEGRPAKEIAAILSVSVKTVEFHRSQITHKLGIRTTAELTKYALEKGIVGA